MTAKGQERLMQIILAPVISEKSIPYGLIKKWCAPPDRRAEMCVKTRSSQPYRAIRR